MAERQHPMAEENERTDVAEDTVKAVAVRKIGKRSDMSSSAKEQGTIATPGNAASIDGDQPEPVTLYDEEEDGQETLKMPVLKKGRLNVDDDFSETDVDFVAITTDSLPALSTLAQDRSDIQVPHLLVESDMDYSELDVDYATWLPIVSIDADTVTQTEANTEAITESISEHDTARASAPGVTDIQAERIAESNPGAEEEGILDSDTDGDGGEEISQVVPDTSSEEQPELSQPSEEAAVAEIADTDTRRGEGLPRPSSPAESPLEIQRAGQALAPTETNDIIGEVVGDRADDADDVPFERDVQDASVEQEAVSSANKKITVPLSEEVTETPSVEASSLPVEPESSVAETPSSADEAMLAPAESTIEQIVDEESANAAEASSVEPGGDVHEDEPVLEQVEPAITPSAEQKEVAEAAVESEAGPYSAKMYAYVHRGQKRRRLSWRRILTGLFLLVLIVNVFFLWRDVQATHIYLTTINAGDGSIRAQQDVGSYQGGTTLTAPVYSSSSVFVGVQSDNGQGTTQQVRAFTGNDTGWSAATQFSASLTNGALQLAPGGQLVTSSATGVQVRAADGRLLWHAPDGQPSLGTHRFQPTTDGRSLYIIKSIKHSQIAAYDLQTGQPQWVQTLDDGVEYAPPFLLNGNVLYVASNHNIYALNSNSGNVLWQRAYPTRTLLITRQGSTQLLLSAGTRGLVALDSATGQPRWTFGGQANNALTATEFYQASISSVPTATSTFVYATGITWQLPAIQQQVWLYAVNAQTGVLAWSQQVGAGFSTADAGRIFAPLVDSAHELVVLQQETATNKQRIVAFDALRGIPRWSTEAENTTVTASTLLQTPDNTLLFFSSSVSGGLQWHTFSLPRLLMLLASMGSVIGLLVILLLPLSLSIGRFSSLIAFGHARVRRIASLEHYSLRAMLLIVLLPIILAGVLDYFVMSKPQEDVYQLASHTGSTQWQSTLGQGVKPLFTDGQESVVAVNYGDNQHQLQVLSSHGSVNWQTFPSEGTFSAPIGAPRPGTVLIALSGGGPRNYQFAPDDPAYLHGINSFLMLYLFNQSTGQVLWQHIAIYPGEQQQGVVLGADANDVYIAGTETLAAPNSAGQTMQLFAINQQTGVVDWRIFGPQEAARVRHDDGKLLLRPGLAVWQVAGIVYGVDTAVGQIAWRHPLVQDDPAVLIQEEQHMATLRDALLVTRLDGVHALDLASGTELWQLPQLSTAPVHSASGIEVVGQTLLVYGNDQLAAFDAQSHQGLWQQRQMENIQHVWISDDGKYMYVLLLRGVGATTPAPSIVALDVRTGAIHWTFRPSGQIFNDSNYTDNFLYSHGELFVTVCAQLSASPCNEQRLYALNGATGRADWKLASNAISDIQVSQDGSKVLLYAKSSPWEELIGQLKG